MKSLKDHIQEKKMDPVGKADADIDNDGDVDSSDKYLHNRRKAIKKAMKKEACWDGYKQVGMKKKGNKKVPNCVPEETQKKDHQTISYVTHGGQKGKVQVHKDNAFKALNHYRKNNKSAQFEEMSPESRKAHGRMFKAAAKKKHDAQAQADREKRLKAKGWVRNDRGGFSKEEVERVDEVHDRYMRAHGKKASGHGRWAFTTSRYGQSQPGQTFVHTGNFSDAHKKAKKHFGKPVYVMEKVEQVDEWSSSIEKARNRVNRAKTGQQTFGDKVHNAVHKVKSKFSSNKPVKQTGLYHAIKKEETVDETIYHDTGWRKVSGPRKDKYGNTIKKKNVAKHLAKKGMTKASAFSSKKEEVDLDEDVTTALKKKASKSGISVSTLRKVYNRGVAAWRTGHRPGTTPSQWGMARVNSYITKGKGTYHGADKDLREDIERHADVKMVKTKAPDGRPVWKKQRKETEVSKHNEGVDYHHIDDIEIAIGEFVGVEKLQEALNRLQQMKYAKAAKELKAYAKKRGGIDKKDFLMAAQLMDDGEAMELAKFVKKMDTDPRDYVYTVMAKHGLMKKR